MHNLKEIAGQFRLDGHVHDIIPFGNGLINDSYRIVNAVPGKPDYLLQRINHAIFRDVDMLQRNILAVTAHIRRKLTECGEQDIDRKVLEFITTADGGSCYYDGENYWRVMKFIPRSVSYEAVTPANSRLAGEAFGRFEELLSDLPFELGETIPDFHNMKFRLEQLREALTADRVGRLAQVAAIVEQLEERATEMCKAERLHRDGLLPKRICHCDTKVNNMLFDSDTGEVLCVIDLDMVMPGFVFSDYGDFMRTAANTGAEDDPDLDRVGLNWPIFEAFTTGYLKGAGGFLTPAEIENLPYAAARFAYMQTVRFLADYINGDTYYKIEYPEHNLVRARAQFKLLQSIEEHTGRMTDFIAGLISG